MAIHDIERYSQEALDRVLKSLEKMKTEDLEKTATLLSRRGLFTSPYGTKPLADVQEQYASKAADVIANMNLDLAKTKTNYEQWLQEYGLRQQQLDEERRRRALEEARWKEYMDAVRRQQENWWQPVLGQVAGTALSALLPGVGTAIGAGLGLLSSQKQTPTLPPSLSLYNNPYTTPGFPSWPQVFRG